MFYLRSRVFPQKSLLYFSSLFIISFGTIVINDWKTIFDIATVLKITIFPESFLILHVSMLFEYLLHPYKFFVIP